MWSLAPRSALVVAILFATLTPAYAHDAPHERIEKLSRDIAREPDNVDLLIKRADLYRELGESMRALTDFEHAFRLAPDREIIQLERAATLYDLGSFAQALVAIDKFLTRRPGHMVAWRVRAHCLLGLKRIPEAISALDYMVSLPDSPTPDDYILRARLVASLGGSRIDDAIAGLDDGLSKLGPAVSLQMAATDLERQRGAHKAVELRSDEMQSRQFTLSIPHDELRSTTTPSSSSTATVSVTRAPYLQVGSDDSVVLRWRTSMATDGRVQFGTELDSLDQVVDDSTLTTEHAVTLTGLLPETRYFYSVGSTEEPLEGGDANHYFDTAPPVGERRPMRVWVIGDSGTKGLRAAGVRNAYRNHPGSANTDVWLMLGDNAYEEGTDAEYQDAVFDMYPTFLRNTVLWSTRGNHDLLYAGSNNDYYDVFTLPAAAEAGGLASGSEAYYAFDYANVHFVCLDSQGSDRTPGGAMLTWLQQDLAATNQEWIIAFWHHPPYSKGSHDSDAEVRLTQMRTNAVPLLEAAGVDLVLAGHSHSYERSFLIDGHYGVSSTLHDSMKVDAGDGRPEGDGAYKKPAAGPQSHNGAVYTVAGTSGSVGPGTYDHPIMITSLAKLGSLVLDIDGDELRATFIDTTGAGLDSFVVSKADLPSAVRKPVTPAIDLAIRPNPFADDAQLSYSLSSDRRVTLEIFNVRGQHVRTLLDRHQERGAHSATWDGRNQHGTRVAQGVYFAVLRMGPEKRTARLVLIR